MKSPRQVSVVDVPEKVLNRPYYELASLGLDWQGYLPLIHPVSLRVISVVSLACPDEPSPWVRADVREGKLVNIGHANARDVAVLRRSLPSES